MPETWQDEEWGNLASVVGFQTDIVLPVFARGRRLAVSSVSRM